MPWANTPEGQAKRAAWMAANRERRRVRHLQLSQTPEARAKQHDHRASDRGRANHRKYRESPRGKIVWKTQNARWAANNWAKVLIHSARRSEITRSGARKSRKDLTISLTVECLERLWAEQNGLCFWTRVPMDKQRGSPWKVSIDRIDNLQGYTEDNIVLSSWLANRARGSLTVDEFRKALAMVVRNLS